MRQDVFSHFPVFVSPLGASTSASLLAAAVVVFDFRLLHDSSNTRTSGGRAQTLTVQFPEKQDDHFSNSPRRSTSGADILVCMFFHFYGFHEIAYPHLEYKDLAKFELTSVGKM